MNTILTAGKAFDTHYSEMHSTPWWLFVFLFSFILLFGVRVFTEDTRSGKYVQIAATSTVILIAILSILLNFNQRHQEQKQWVAYVHENIEELYDIKLQTNEVYKLLGFYLHGAGEEEASLITVEQGERSYLQVKVIPRMVNDQLSLYAVTRVDTEVPLEQYLLEHGNLV